MPSRQYFKFELETLGCQVSEVNLTNERASTIACDSPLLRPQHVVGSDRATSRASLAGVVRNRCKGLDDQLSAAAYGVQRSILRLSSAKADRALLHRAT